MDGWTIADRAYTLFEEEYRLPLLDPELAARFPSLIRSGRNHAYPRRLAD